MTTCVALLETIETKRISNIQFGLHDPAVIRKMSVCHVNKAALYVRHLPVRGGLNDLRMGTSDRRLPCATCRADVLDCVGHVGHIELAAPMYHVSMLAVVVKILRCVCYFCSRLLVDAADDARVAGNNRLKNSDPKDRLNLMVNLCKTKHFCRHCGGPQPKYVQIRAAGRVNTEFRPKDDGAFECEAEKQFVRRPFTAAAARIILEMIPDEDVALLGINPVFARPEWLVLTVLQVPPPIARPCIMATDGSRTRGQDDITIKLQEIVKANITLAASLGLGTASAAAAAADNVLFARDNVLFARDLTAAQQLAVDTLQQHLMQFMHHDGGGASVTAGVAVASSGRNKRVLRLVPARLKGKKGRFRGTLGGKRVDYSARSVVSPAPTYDIHEVGVPQVIAQQLTFPERVNEVNRAELQQRVRNGAGHPQGASGVVMPDGTLIDLSLCPDARARDVELQPGWVVERYLRDGDWVLFNRQPSLHRMSIMAHQVRVIHDKTFRLPVCDTTPYNADFDGDEMNLHVLRSYEAIAEAQELMSVNTQIISPQSNKPIIGLVQDSLVSVYLLTQRDTFLTREQLMQIVMVIKYPVHEQHLALPPPAVLKPRALWTGKQLFSMLLPASLSIDMVVRSGSADGVGKDQDGAMDPQERRVVIRRGALCAGSLCKKTMGTSAGGIIHVLVKDFGNVAAARFIGDAQRILVEYMLIRGFSVGIGDCMMERGTHDKVAASISRCLEYGDSIVRNDAASATTSGAAGAAAVVEACLAKLMTGVLGRAGAIVQQDLPVDNNVFTMVQSGAKGSAVNIAQILACVGQQSVEGGRIALDGDERTLPSYKRGDTSAASRGFVANSYGTGLTAQEYFFHAMGGREGLVDTAVKTASTGYIQRRLVKSEEGLQVRYDHSVRNSRDEIVQFYYGGDCFDAAFVEKHSLRTFAMSDAAMRTAFAFAASDLPASSPAPAPFDAWQAALDAEFEQLRQDRDRVRDAKLRLHPQCPADAVVFVTVCVPRVLDTAETRFRRSRDGDGNGNGVGAGDAQEVARLLRRACADIESQRRSTATGVTLAYVRSVFALKEVAVTRRLSLEAIDWCADAIARAYRASLVHPGEMVGTLGAASIGEPCTQMTLNTFHTAGVAGKTVTLGVPRLKELIDTTRNIRTPSMSVYFTGAYATSEKMARAFGTGLESTLLQHVVRTSSVELDPDVWHTRSATDAPIVDAYRALFCRRGGGGGSNALSAWVIRFELDRETLCRRQLNVQHVARAVRAFMGECAQIMCSEVNMLTWCVRVRVKKMRALAGGGQAASDNDDDDDDDAEHLQFECMKTIHDFLLDNVPVHGVPGLKRAIVRKLPVTRVATDASGALCQTEEWMADTEGTSLRSTLALAFIDKCRTISNDIHEVLDVLGIEAAQQVLLEEIRTVLSFDGSYVNERHLQLLVDVMTFSGTLTAMTRHSMHKLGGSAYHHASFEETQDVLINAAAYGLYDNVSGVTENLMMGMMMPGGTGSCSIICTAPPPPPPPPPTGAAAVLVVRPLPAPAPAPAPPPVQAPAIVVRPLGDGGGAAKAVVVVRPLGAPPRQAEPMPMPTPPPVDEAAEAAEAADAADAQPEEGKGRRPTTTKKRASSSSSSRSRARPRKRPVTADDDDASAPTPPPAATATAPVAALFRQFRPRAQAPTTDRLFVPLSPTTTTTVARRQFVPLSPRRAPLFQ